VLRVYRLGCKVETERLRVTGYGLRVQGSEFRVEV
jgi:hypothetical protein